MVWRDLAFPSSLGWNPLGCADRRVLRLKPQNYYSIFSGEGSIEFNGLFDSATTGATHEALKTVGVDKTAGIAYGNNAAPTIGDIAAALPVHQSSYKASADLDGTIAAAASLKSAGYPLDWGVLLANVTGANAGDETTAVDDGAGSSDGARGYLFISAVTAGDELEVVIQDSPDNSTWNNLITFTLDGSDIDSERIEVSGSVDRYVRVSYTVTDGSGAPDFDFAVIFHRK